MNQTNKKTKVKREYKFNLVDLLLIILCLAIVGGAVYIFSPSTSFDLFSKKEITDIEYTIEIQGVNKEFIETIKENDTVIDSVTKSALGQVVAVDYNTKYTTLSFTQSEDNNVGVLVEHPDKYNLIITISAQAEYKQGKGYFINDRRISVGGLMQLRFPNYVCECYCIAISI